MSELEQVKIWLGDIAIDDDELIEMLLGVADKIIKGNTRVSSDFQYLKIEAVVFAYNQRGAEGSKSGGSGGFSTSWANSIMSSFIKSNMPAQFIV